MADATTEPQGQEPANTRTEAPQGGGGRSIDSFPEEAQDYIRRLRQENAGHRNDLKSANERLKSFEDRDKTEQQRLTERAETAERAVSAGALKLLRYEVAAEHGLSLRQAARLQGSTKEELVADVDNLKQDLGLTEPAAPAGGSGLDGGVRRPVSTRKPKGMNGLIRQVSGR